jgi:transcription-repair coupling factor (superfamily II helicase)
MVSEAVSELKGEPVRQPAEVKLDLPVDAHLPAGYVTREDLRLEAYRRLAGVTDHEEVDDIRTEWIDRYGPLPPPAEALLRIGDLRAECVRTGVREVTVVRDTARLAPLALKASARVRLQRLWPKAIYKEETGQVVLPLPRDQDPAALLNGFLAEMVPLDPPSVASPAP